MRLNIHLSVLAVSLFFSLNSCKSNKYTPESPSQASITFGSGGGFTGAVTEYLLCDNGQMFMHNSLEKDWERLENTSKSEARDLFARAMQLDWKSINLNDPGNYSYFIRLKNQETDKKIVWGNSAAPENIQLLYTELNQVVRKKVKN